MNVKLWLNSSVTLCLIIIGSANYTLEKIINFIKMYEILYLWLAH